MLFNSNYILKAISFIVVFFSTITLVYSDAESRVSFNEFKQKYNEALDKGPDSTVNILNQFLYVFNSKQENNVVLKYLADAFIDKGDFHKADSIYQLIQSYFISMEMHHITLSIFKNKGLLYYQLGDLRSGINNGTKALKYIDEFYSELLDTKSIEYISQIYSHLGIVYAIQADREDLSENSKSEYYFRQAYNVLKPYDLYEAKGLALLNIGNVKITNDSITFYWSKALKIFEKHNLDNHATSLTINLGSHFMDNEGDYEQGLTYLSQLSESDIDSLAPYQKAIYLTKLGSGNLGLKKNSEALAYLRKGLELSEEHNLLDLQREASSLLIQVYKHLKEYKKALEMNVRYDSIVKMMDRLEVERLILETEARFKFKEQNQEILLLTKNDELKANKITRQRLIIGITLVSIFLVVVLTLLIWKQSVERRAKNEELVKLDQEKTRFLMNVSHEIRTPLTLIQAPLEDSLMKLENKDTLGVKKNLEIINRNTRKLADLTNEILSISVLEGKHLVHQPEPTLLHSFLNRVFFSFESLATQYKVNWVSEIRLESKHYLLDQEKVEKTINNLLTNALKNSNEGDQVKFQAHILDDDLIINISDTGKGISKADLPFIFDRYYQVKGDARLSEGLGIGLAYVRELVDVMNADIKVESEVNVGTKFTLRIPVIQSDQTTNEKMFRGIEGQENVSDFSLEISSDQQPHILVIEDNIEMRDFMRQLLEEDYNVSVAKNGLEGLERLKTIGFDMITVDVMMPLMDGLSFVSEVKAHSVWKQIPIVMITALSSRDDKLTGLELGIDDYITKPFSPSELKARVANLLLNASVRKSTNYKEDELPQGTEHKLIRQAVLEVESHLDKNNFAVHDFASSLNLSERQANRVIKKLTGLSCIQFIREVRLKHAYTMLETRKYNSVAEVAYAIGFESSSYFSKLFIKRFGKRPSEMLKL